MNIYSSFLRSFEAFKPIKDKKVVMYVCGLTPYDYVHIGHTRTYIAFDIIKRYLIKKGYKVFHIQNITDVEDKIIKRSKETGISPTKLVSTHHDEALELFNKLNIIRADVYPKVTENIKEIISLIKKLLEKKYAYETKTGIYFQVSKFSDYGELSNQKLDEIKSGARIEIDETKKSPEDFALWKKTKDEIIEFDSPFGRGRPGWHIECSAMAEKYAKNTLDIHGGARDLIFPHHENEIAQSEAALNKKFCNYWLHTGFLTVNGEKMSKSLGNFIKLKDVVSKFSLNAIRLFFIQAHYRSPIDYNEEQLQVAEENAERIFNTLGLMLESSKNKNSKIDKDFRSATEEKLKEFYQKLDNDFNTPEALATFFDLLRIINSNTSGKTIDISHVKMLIEELEKILWIFGLKEDKKDIDKKLNEIDEVQEWLHKTFNYMFKEKKNPEKILDEIILFRDSLRLEKKYKESDLVRDKLKAVGIILEDKEKGKRWKLID